MATTVINIRIPEETVEDIERQLMLFNTREGVRLTRNQYVEKLINDSLKRQKETA
jgi:hypothetical protein